MFRSITDRVTLVGGSELSDGMDCLVYIIDMGAGQLVLIDSGAGPSWNKIANNIAESGRDPAKISTLILTHCHIDHIGATAEVVRQTQCQVVAHEADTEAIETGDPRRTAASWYGLSQESIQVTQRIRGSEKTLSFPEGEVRLIHTPGHTPGSMVVLFEDLGNRVLFGQDIHGPFMPDFDSDITQWRRSMKMLLELDADVLCEGHYGIFRPAIEVRRFIEGQLASH